MTKNFTKLNLEKQEVSVLWVMVLRMLSISPDTNKKYVILRYMALINSMRLK